MRSSTAARTEEGFSARRAKTAWAAPSKASATVAPKPRTPTSAPCSKCSNSTPRSRRPDLDESSRVRRPANDVGESCREFLFNSAWTESASIAAPLAERERGCEQTRRKEGVMPVAARTDRESQQDVLRELRRD